LESLWGANPERRRRNCGTGMQVRSTQCRGKCTPVQDKVESARRLLLGVGIEEGAGEKKISKPLRKNKGEVNPVAESENDIFPCKKRTELKKGNFKMKET